LQKYTSHKLDCDAELIDYTARNEYVGKRLIFTRIKRFGTYLRNASKYYTLYRNQQNQAIKCRAFDAFFEKHLTVSEKKADTLEGVAAVCAQYGALMIGSDQTWNPFVSTKGAFLLDYLDTPAVKLAYAPSLGIGKIPAEHEERYKRALSDFQALSCRERGGAAYLSELVGRPVSFVLDPTLLLTPADWEQIAEPVAIGEPYLLTYFLGDNKAHRREAKRIAAEKNLKIVSLPVSYLEMWDKQAIKKYVGPGGFISLIKNASFICTDSFHGTMFSINFGRDFVSFPKRDDAEANSDNNRLYDALDVFGLQNRLFLKGTAESGAIDYASVHAKLTALRASSHAYLQKAVSCIKPDGRVKGNADDE